MRTAVYSIFILLLLANCKPPAKTEAGTKSDPEKTKAADDLFFYSPGPALAIDSSSPEGTFFINIYKKYPDDYFPLGSGAFAETFDAKTGEMHWKFSFFEMDSTKKGAAKYLVETTDPLFSKYCPGVHLYRGIHSHHYEVGGSAQFGGFVCGDSADMISNSVGPGISSGFIKQLNKVMISGRNEKEEFGKALLKAISPGTFLYSQDYHLESCVTTWTGNRLAVTGNFKYGKSALANVLYISFDGDRIKALSLTP